MDNKTITNIIYNNKKCKLEFNLSEGDINFIENHFKKINYEYYDIYEFGTYLGNSITGIFEYISNNDIIFNNFVGFDSLKGLPLEKIDKNNNKNWIKGKFSIEEKFKKDLSEKEYINYLINNDSLPLKYKDKFIMIKGFYEDTLNENILSKLKLPIFINIDCDIYTSTIQVLEFIFKNKLYINGKTIIRYDDWANNNMEYKTGQSLAHKEMTQKYNINCKLLLKHSRNKDPEATWWLID
jgi:hypothetical protein